MKKREYTEFKKMLKNLPAVRIDSFGNSSDYCYSKYIFKTVLFNDLFYMIESHPEKDSGFFEHFYIGYHSKDVTNGQFRVSLLEGHFIVHNDPAHVQLSPGKVVRDFYIHGIESTEFYINKNNLKQKVIKWCIFRGF